MKTLRFCYLGLTVLSTLAGNTAVADIATQQWSYVASVPYATQELRILRFRGDRLGGGLASLQVRRASGDTARKWICVWLDANGNEIWRSPDLPNQPELIEVSPHHILFGQYVEVDGESLWRLTRVLKTNNEFTSIEQYTDPLSIDGANLIDTRFDARGFFTLPSPFTTLFRYSYPVTAPSVTISPSEFGLNGSNAIVRWPSSAGLTYQIQKAIDTPTTWEDVGAALVGTGELMSYSEAITTENPVFLRVIQR